jgi:hypothetical protein
MGDGLEYGGMILIPRVRRQFTLCEDLVDLGTTIGSMKTYWLHIVEMKSPQSHSPSTYMLSHAPLPDRELAGGAMPTVHYPSWAELGKKLSSVGIDGAVLHDTKENLDSKGSYTISNVLLSDVQAEWLGFVNLVA